MSYPVRTALAGIGGYGGVHLKALEALEQEGKVKLVAVADPRCYANQTTVARLRNAGVRVLVDWHDL
jgi:predicted dehydrogenase